MTAGHAIPCFGLVLALHAVACWLALHSQPIPHAAQSAAVVIDLLPPPAATRLPPIEMSRAPMPAVLTPSSMPSEIREPLAFVAASTPSVDRAEPASAILTLPVAQPPLVAAGAEPSTDAMSNWQRLVLNRLEQFKRYPRMAQLRRQQGVVYLRFMVDRHGRVLFARIEKNSGFDSLDDEALALIHRAEPLPPPPEVAGDAIELIVPVQFFSR